MESSDMKNMLVIKNLPSNMVEEAIIIFKENQKIREKELIEKGEKINSADVQTKSKEYILKEAEMLVTDYINKLEEKKSIPKSTKNLIQKHKILNIYSITITIILTISLVINFI